MEEIKPCPFCKNKLPRVISYGIESGIINQVHCDICGASGPDHADSKEKAINAWNKRSLSMADKEERILIDIIEPGLNCVYRMDNDPKGLSLCKHNGEEKPVSEKDCKSCLEGMTRPEAIRRIAIGWCSANKDCNYCDDGEKGSEDCLNYLIVKGKLKNAEAALNALLEGGK